MTIEEQLAVEREKVRTLTEDVTRARHIANELTLETQTVEDWTVDLARLVREARALALSYRNGEVVTEGTARLVDAQTASLKGKLDDARASRHDLAMRVADRVREAVNEAWEAGDVVTFVDLDALVAECEASHG